jgi:hemerythrin-like domain-containing protein
MHPTEILSLEHRAIEAKLDELEAEIARAEGGEPFPAAFFAEALDFFRHFADGCHHAKEENLLFPLLKERGMPVNGGPIGVMLAEHDEGRAYLKAVRENLEAAGQGSGAARQQVYANARGYIRLLRNHIYKEDNILFRMARTILAPDDVAELKRQFAAVEVPERFQALAV